MVDAEKTTETPKRGRPSTRTGTERAHTFRLEAALLNKAKTLSQLRGITLNEAINVAVQSWLHAPENKAALANFAKEIQGDEPQASVKRQGKRITLKK